MSFHLQQDNLIKKVITIQLTIIIIALTKAYRASRTPFLVHDLTYLNLYKHAHSQGQFDTESDFIAYYNLNWSDLYHLGSQPPYHRPHHVTNQNRP